MRCGVSPIPILKESPAPLEDDGPLITTAITSYDLNGMRVAQQRDGDFTWIHADHLSSATRLTDINGLEVRRLAYTAFGEHADSQGTGDDPKYTYTSKELDTTGLYYYGARYYNPILCRFITADTVYDTGPQGLNRYSYALNNPVIYRDPKGYQALGYGNPFYHLVKGIQRGGSAVTRVVRAGSEWVVDHGDEISKGLEQVELALEIAGGGMFIQGSGKAAAGLTAKAIGMGATATGVGAPAGVPVAGAGATATIAGAAEMGAGIVLMAGGKVVGYIGKKLREANEEKKYRGGTHKDTKKPTRDDLDSHHTPAKDSYSHTDLDPEDGPAIQMDPEDHRKTASYGSSADAQTYRDIQRELINQGQWDDAIQMDIDDVQSKFGDKYDDAILEMIDSIPDNLN